MAYNFIYIRIIIVDTNTITMFNCIFHIFRKVPYRLVHIIFVNLIDHEFLPCIIFKNLYRSLFLSRPRLNNVLYAELNLDNLLNNNNQIKKYQKTSSYPHAIRDLSLRVNKNVLSDQISDIIKQNPLVTDLNVIDVYNDLEPGKKSITFRITYQSFNETLNNKKIDESQNKILNKLKKQLNIEIRKI